MIIIHKLWAGNSISRYVSGGELNKELRELWAIRKKNINSFWLRLNTARWYADDDV